MGSFNSSNTSRFAYDVPCTGWCFPNPGNVKSALLILSCYSMLFFLIKLCNLRKSDFWKLFSTANYLVQSVVNNPIKSFKDSLKVHSRIHAIWPQFWMAEEKLNSNLFDACPKLIRIMTKRRYLMQALCQRQGSRATHIPMTRSAISHQGRYSN